MLENVSRSEYQGKCGSIREKETKNGKFLYIFKVLDEKQEKFLDISCWGDNEEHCENLKKLAEEFKEMREEGKKLWVRIVYTSIDVYKERPQFTGVLVEVSR